MWKPPISPFLIVRGALKKKLGPTRGGLTESQLFVIFFQKPNFPLELSINVVKHTLHKWRGLAKKSKNTSCYIFLGVLQAMLVNFNKRDLNKSNLEFTDVTSYMWQCYRWYVLAAISIFVPQYFSNDLTILLYNICVIFLQYFSTIFVWHSYNISL